jgi:hypothetical protein
MTTNLALGGIAHPHLESIWSPSGVQILYLRFTWSPDTVSGVPDEIHQDPWGSVTYRHTSGNRGGAGMTGRS